MALNFENIDLGTFGISEDTQPDLNIQVRANMDEALKVNPDQHAKITTLSQQSDIPEFAVESDPAKVEHELKLDNIDFSQMSTRNPNTAKYLTDFNNSVIAQDDIDVLQSIEDSLNTVGAYAFDISESFEKGQLIVESSEIGLSRMYQSLGASEIVSDDQIARLQEIEDLTKHGADKYGFFVGAPIAAAEQLPIMYEILRTGLGYAGTGAAIGAGIGAIPGKIPGAIAGAIPGAKIGGRIGVAKAAFDLEAGLAFNEFSVLKDEKGKLLNPQIAGGAAAIVGSINAGLEFISLAALGRTVTPVMRSLIKSKVKRALAKETGRQMMMRLMKDYGIAVATEAVTETAQEFTNVMGGELAKYIDKDSFTEQDLSSALDNIFSEETSERVIEAGKKGAQASLIFAGAGTTASVIVETKQREKLSNNEQLRIDALNEQTEKSKLRERDKESFKQFVNEADGENNTNIFIDGAQTSLYLQSKTAEEIEADAALKLLSEQAREAANLGTDVQIPVADFAAEIAGTEHYAELRDSMTMSEETIAPFRQDQVKQETETYVQNLMNEAEESVSEYVEAQEIYTQVRDQLVDTGAVTPANASIMAQIVPAWATAQAKRQGKTVQQVYQDTGLVIEGPQTGERARLEGEMVLSQEGITTADLQTSLQEEGVDVRLMGEGDVVTLDKIVVPEEQREEGVGTAAMQRVTEWADANGKTIALSPSKDFGGTVARLKKFYKGLGFVENKGKNKDLEISESMYRPAQRPEVLAQAPVEIVSTETEAFKKWSGDGEVVEPEDVNDYVFKADTPTVVKVFHGTTHKFDVFDALRGNLEGQFGAINYFTSSEQDASDNYVGEGPDLTGRIEQRAEQIDSEQEIGMDEAREIARQELSGGGEQLMELFVRVDNPFVIGENAEWIEFVDNEATQTDVMEQVAEDNDITVKELEERHDEFEDAIDEKRWEIESETPNKLIEAIETVSINTTGIEAAELMSQVFELGSEATPETIEKLLRSSEDYAFAEDPETGELIGFQLIAEVIEEMGFDSIILRNAEQRFKNMTMESGTAHVHVFDSKKTNIKSVENIGTFDPSEPSIFRQQEGERPARGYYDPANSVIRLTEAADLSTFLHEFAHFMYEMEVNGDTEMLQSINNWYKRNAEDVAKEAMTYVDGEFDVLKQGERTTEKPVEITADDVTAYLDNETTGNKDKDSAIRRAVHEQFARGFETYLMEGKAPSIELRNAFRAFARWLVRIYQNIRGQLDVKVDDQIREVFDRLLATEEQIQAAEARARVEPMFTDAAMAGMTEAEFADYQKRQEKVKDVQSETLRDKIIKQLTRQTQKWWKEEKSDIVDEEIESLNKQQVYIARTRLKDGDIKLDHATVKEMTGEERVNKLGRKSIIIPPALNGMTAKGQKGIHPDEAAAFFGYKSGSEMLHDLTTAPKIKVQAEVNAEVRMIDRHGDILTDGTIEQQADEAVQNEERGKLILHELKTLAKGTNAPVIERNTIKELATINIGKLSFREIHPGKYRKAEIRVAQESTAMLAAGNREGAATAKMRQVMNYYLGMAATDAKNDTTKIVDRMARYNKKKVREEIMKAEGGYWDQIVKILDRFEFRKSATLKEVESINTWAKERMESDGDGLVLSNAVLNESFVTHWKNVPFSDLQGINDSVKNIEHVARYANKMTGMQEEIDFKTLKANWIDSINTQDARFKTKESRSRIDDARKSTAQEHIQRWISQLTKIPFLASWLDGGDRVGISHDILVQPFTTALDAKMTMVDNVATPVVKAIAGRSKADQKRHMTKIYIPEIDDTILGHQVLAVALNTGNQGNLKKMLLGEGWANPENEAEITADNSQLQAVLAHMTKTDWELVQLIWDQMETLYPQLAEVHRRTTGLAPPKVESTPVVTKFGTFKGGYYPVKYSPKRSHKAEKNAEKLEAETESMFNNTASIQSSVNAGATNERTGFYDRIHLSLEVVPDHFNETIHYITHHDAVRQTNRLIQSNDVANAITGVLGEAEYKELKPWLNDIAKDGRQQPVKTFIDEAFQRLRFGTTLGVMGFKASTGIMQLFGLFTTGAELGVGPTLKGVQTTIGRSWYMRSARKLLGSTDDLQSGWEFASERSKVLPHRVQTMDREIRNAMNRLSKKTGTLAATQETSMKHIALIQTYMVDLPTWHAAYDKHLSNFGDEAKAVRFADVTVENTQGSGATKDMARIMRNQSKIHSTFTMFMTFFSSLGNLTRDLARGAKSGQYSLTSTAAKTMFLFTIPLFLEMLMRGELDEPDDEDERMSKFLTGLALYPLTSVPFVRDVASGALSDFGYNSTPVAALMERGITSGKGLVKNLLTDEEVTKGQLKNVSKLVGAAIGIPGMNQIWSTGEHLYDVIEEGEELTAQELLFGPRR